MPLVELHVHVIEPPVATGVRTIFPPPGILVERYTIVILPLVPTVTEVTSLPLIDAAVAMPAKTFVVGKFPVED